jgi:hypothetical protein
VHYFPPSNPWFQLQLDAARLTYEAQTQLFLGMLGRAAADEPTQPKRPAKRTAVAHRSATSIPGPRSGAGTRGERAANKGPKARRARPTSSTKHA